MLLSPKQWKDYWKEVNRQKTVARKLINNYRYKQLPMFEELVDKEMKRVKDFKGDYLALAEIDGEEVVITSVVTTSEVLNGENRSKTLITLDDGRVVTAWSDNVGRTLARIPEDKFPVQAKFSLVHKNGKSFWNID